MTSGYPCECCGFLTLSDSASGSYEICPVCLWEDDPVQRDDPSYAGGANHVSLHQARRSFIEFGASTPTCVGVVRDALPCEIPPGEEPRAIQIALLCMVRSIRRGSIPLFEGCIVVSGLASTLRGRDTQFDGLLNSFVAIASELDDSPMGRVRELWAPAALAKRDAQLADYHARVAPSVWNDCHELEQRLVATLLTRNAP